jgi:hypothetical protein
MARFPQLDYTIGQARRRLFEPQLEVVFSRMHDVMADLLLLAPRDLVPAIEAVNKVMTAVDAADPRWWQRWQAARADLVRASRAVLQDRQVDAALAIPQRGHKQHTESHNGGPVGPKPAEA